LNSILQNYILLIYMQIWIILGGNSFSEKFQWQDAYQVSWMTRRCGRKIIVLKSSRKIPFLLHWPIIVPTLKTWNELCAVLPSFLLAPSHSFSLDFLPSLSIPLTVPLFFALYLSLLLPYFSLSRYILAWNLNITHYWQTYWYSWMREAGDTKWDGRTSSSICWKEHQPQFGLRPGGGSTAVRSMHLHTPQHLLYPFPNSPAPLFLYSSFGV